MTEADLAPFRVGDRVVYTPSDRGSALAANDPPAARLTPGHAYRVVEIQEGRYVIVEGHDHPGGGLHWSESRAAP